MPNCFSKTLYHFVFIPAIYQSPNFSILLSIFVIICVFDFSHPCECGVMSCGFDFISLDILECELRWALESITTNRARGGDEIPVELFQILKDDAVKVLHSICQEFGKLSSGHRTGKGQFSFQSQRKAIPKNAQTTAQLHSSHMLVK